MMVFGPRRRVLVIAATSPASPPSWKHTGRSRAAILASLFSRCALTAKVAWGRW
jgi:hypothetical protein